MKRFGYFSIIAWLALALIGLGVLSTPADAKHKNHFPDMRPMIFVHGYTGSASQFGWQAMRFASNGYPQNYLNAFEYDSPRYRTDPTYAGQIFDGLDQRIDAILQETGVDAVELLGHSMGTFILQSYLNSSAERAAKVAHYVNLDGGSADSLPGGVPTLAIFGGFGFNPAGSITGAQNEVVPKQLHNETCTSPESFALMYKFFTGFDPAVTDVLPERHGRIRLVGRAVLYPANVGAAGSTVEIYELNGETGARKHRRPVAVYQIDETGDFGPFKAKGDTYYEFNIARDTGNHHFYFEPRIRSDYFIRLNTSLPGQGLGSLMTRNPDQSNLIITRNREFLGDQTDGFNDTLAINGINIVNATSSPKSRAVVAYFICDWESDYITDLSTPLPAPLTSTFLSGVDLYQLGTTPPDATITIVDIPRGDCGSIHGINVPNWAIINEAGTFTESISVVLDDYIESRCDERWDAPRWHRNNGR